MKNSLLLLALLACFCTSPVHATDQALGFSVNEKTGAIVLRDPRTGRVWEQVLLGDKPLQRLVKEDPSKRIFQLECVLPAFRRNGKPEAAPFQITATLSKSRPEVELSFLFTGTGQWLEVSYPYVFTMTEPGACNLYPHGEGMLVPVKKSDPDSLDFISDFYYGGVHSLMACLGVLDPVGGSGIFTILPNIESTRANWTVTPGGESVIKFGWQPNKGTFDRPYKMLVSLYDQGGYVAMARRYREWFAATGQRRSFAEKAQANPDVNQLAGAMVFYPMGGNSPQPAKNMADLIKANGVERCLIAMPAPYAPQYQYKDRAELKTVFGHVLELGYTPFRYDQFRDAFRPDPSLGAHFQLNTDAWPDKLAMQESGIQVAAFGPDKSGVICPKFFVPLAKKHLPEIFAEFPYKAWYLDCLGSVSFNFEGDCFSREHPADNFDAHRERLALLQYVRSLGKLTSTECGLDYLCPVVDWFEGATSLIAFVEKYPPSVLAASGAKDDAELWKRAEKALPTERVPWTVNLSTKYRIPFWSLAHHDEAMNTWRVEDGMHNQPVYWARKNLWSALYAAAPMYRPFEFEVKKYAAQMGQTAKYIGFVTRRVGLAAMIDHRFLTPDRQVQETRFEGGFGVIANFGENPFRTEGGPEIPPGEYVAFEPKGSGRLYLAPPCRNLSPEELAAAVQSKPK